MDFQNLLQIIEPILGHAFDDEQLDVIKHGEGPLWVVAGPGSGKTEVLVVRTLQLIFVENVNPKSIIITTFTNKAAKNLFDRILNYASYIFKTNPKLEQQIDIHSLQIGTLHSLCNDIMLESKDPNYENYRLLDDIEQYLFIYEHSDLVNDKLNTYLPMWLNFDYLVEGYDSITGSSGWKDKTRSPNRWKKTKAAIMLFNRIVEDQIDINQLKSAGNTWELLYNAYEDYSQKLESHRRCDFANLQLKFINFLDSPLGALFLNGDGSERHPGIQYIMVDEYQDTNPIQEAIYLKLAKNTHNLCVVGDDDQSLYRFRGGTVDCMVTFDEACEKYWDVSHDQHQLFLNANYRSHPEIVTYYNCYITSFSVMKLKGARVSGKPLVKPKSKISGNHPAVAYTTGRTIPITANDFATFVKDLLDSGIIQKPSQCVLLMRSVKETQRKAGPFSDALREVGIQPYNPRSKTFLQQEEIMAILGTFISIIDPNLSALPTIKGIQEMVNGWIDEYNKIASVSPELSHYVNESIRTIKSKSINTQLDVNIMDIFYRILAHEPFARWENDAERSYRFGKISKIFEIYASIPYPNNPGSNRGNLKTSKTEDGEISFRWRKTFYYSLMGLLVSGLNDPEDEEIICPPDRLPIMTVHQAKGLEFPFVFVYGLNQKSKPDSSILLEDALSSFRQNAPITSFDPSQRAQHDLIRFFYVAYSRAQYALIHLVPNAHFKNAEIGYINKNIKQFKKYVTKLGE